MTPQKNGKGVFVASSLRLHSASGSVRGTPPDPQGVFVPNNGDGDGPLQRVTTTLMIFSPLRVNLEEENVAPVIAGQDSLSTAEDTSITLTLDDLTVADPDNQYPEDFTLTVREGTNYTLDGTTIRPSPDFSGRLTVPVVVSDGVSDSQPYNVKISVTPVNDPPSVTGQNPLPMITSEDTSIGIALSNLIISDVDNSDGFTIRLLQGVNYTVNGADVLPDPDFVGEVLVPVVVNDGEAESTPFDLQITVQNVNDPPRITGQVSLTTAENQPITLELSNITIEDPDPDNFTLSVVSGDYYSVSGTTVTPSPGFNGELSVGIFVNDGTVNSDVFPLKISVTPVNDSPVITAQTRELQVNEDNAITLSLQDLAVTDADNNYPDGFTLIVQPGSGYTFSGTTVTSSQDFTGTLSVNVIVNDGAANSQPYAMQISVIPENDAPVITGPQTLSTNEDVGRTISLSDLAVTDPDNSYPAGFSLIVFQGEHYVVAGTTVTPEVNFSGTLTVQVQVNDGLLNSNIFTIAMQAVPVNDPPVITGQMPVETGEDTPVTIKLPDLTVLDVDNSYPSGFTLAVSPGTNYTFSGSTITPALDFNGTLNVNVTVNDGTANSANFVFQIQVGNANDAPVITGQTALGTNEETPVGISLSYLTVTDPDNVYPTGFSLLVSPGINYTVSGTTVTPAVNFAGVLTIPVRVNDGINNSASFDFQLQVNQVNDPPSFSAIPNQQIMENATAGTIAISGISKGPLEDQQQLTFVATSGNPALVKDPVIQYSGTGSSASLSYSVNPNTSGIVTITVVAIDNGSNVPPNQNSYSSTFQIEVVEINSQPTLDVINNVTILEDAEQQNVSMTGITAGPGEAQMLTVSVSSDKPEFFEMLEVVYTSPETSGLLQFKFKPNIWGAAHLSVTVTDSGPGVSPHVNSITRTFAVTIQAVNDPPVFTSSPVTVAAINEEYEYRISTTDADGEKVTIGAVAKPSWASITDSGNGVAKLSGKPPAAALGDTQVRLQAKDGSSSVDQSFILRVNARPTLSSLSIVTEEDQALSFPSDFFVSGYSDLNSDAMASIELITLPAFGKLLLTDQEVKAMDTIPASSLARLVYQPNPDFFGTDSFGWKAFDGYHFSAAAARVDIAVVSINDAPSVVFESDTLQYEVNGEPAFLSPYLTINDPDDDTLTHASIRFQTQHYRPEMDLLEFKNTGNIRGDFNFQSGTLALTGKAPVTEYISALRSVSYLHQNTLDPILEPKTVSFTLNDGEVESEPSDKIIMLRYTFIEFNIPSGFTPNGDQANDTWVIDRPGGLEDLDRAIISVYDRRGLLVFRAKGFDKPWDGTMNGDLLPADSYFFTIDLQLRNRKTYKGIVTILR